MTLFPKRVYLLFLISLFSHFPLSAQDLTDDVKTWFGYGIGVKIGKRFKVKVGQLYSLDITTFRFGFAQTDVVLAYKLASKHYLQLEYSNSQYRFFDGLQQVGFSENLLGLISYQRFTLAYNTSHQLLKNNKFFKLKHYVSAQVFFPQPVKHRVRFIYTARLYYYNPKWSLKIKPYFATSLHYYLGGRPIAYHNELGDIVAYNAPNGFHRIRTKTGASIKPFKKVPLSITLYLIAQWEFNLNIIPYTGINYKKPEPLNQISYPFEPLDRDIIMPFNNYITLGLHLSYTFKVKLKKKKKKNDAKRN
ncbi:MAG: hypothetical protein AB8E82_06830 [Aureispira sp.]